MTVAPSLLLIALIKSATVSSGTLRSKCRILAILSRNPEQPEVWGLYRNYQIAALQFFRDLIQGQAMHTRLEGV
jgi:hypothetical protein